MCREQRPHIGKGATEGGRSATTRCGADATVIDDPATRQSALVDHTNRREHSRDSGTASGRARQRADDRKAGLPMKPRMAGKAEEAVVDDEERALRSTARPPATGTRSISWSNWPPTARTWRNCDAWRMQAAGMRWTNSSNWLESAATWRNCAGWRRWVSRTPPTCWRRSTKTSTDQRERTLFLATAAGQAAVVICRRAGTAMRRPGMSGSSTSTARPRCTIR